MRIDNPSISGSLAFIGGTNTISATSVSLTGSLAGTFEGSFSSTAVSEISGAFDSVSASLAQDITSNGDSITSLNQASSSYSQRVTATETTIAAINASTSSYLLNTSDTLDGDLTVTGKITAQEFHTEFVSASIIYESGSTQFGNSADDTHVFTGSLLLDGSSLSRNILKVTGTTNEPLARFESNQNRSHIEFKNIQYTGSLGLNLATMYFDLDPANAWGGPSAMIFSIAGDQKMRIDESGNVGIGTLIPDAPIHTVGTHPSNTQSITIGAGTNIAAKFEKADNIQSTSDLYLQPYASGSIIMLNNGGNAGIGTTSPTQRLHVVGAVRTEGAEVLVNTNIPSVGWVTVQPNGNTNGQIAFNVIDGSSNSYASIRGNGDAFFNGNVGIGTSSPTGKFQVNNTGTQILRYTTSANLEVYEPEGQTGYVRLGAAYLKKGLYSNEDLNLWAEGDNPIVFYAGGGGTGSEKMRITSSGVLVNATTSFHATSPTHFVLSGNGTTYTAPSVNTNVPVLTVENTNQGTTGTGHAIVLLRTNTGGNVASGPTAGDPFISFDGFNYAGWTAGVDMSDNRNFKITNGWSAVDGTGVELVYGGTAWQANSDERLKENIVDIGSVLGKIDNLRCVKYNLISDEEMPTQYGFIAQDWQTDFSEVVSVSTDTDSPIENKLSMKYTETIPILMKAIQELKELVVQQQVEIELLKNS